MDLKALLLLALVATCTAQSGDGPDDKNGASATTIVTTDDEGGDSDFSLDGGEGVGSGSGAGEITEVLTTPSDRIPDNTACVDMNCWCLYRDGSVVPDTAMLGLPSCSQYKDKDRPTTAVPMRTKPTDAPFQGRNDIEETITEKEDDIVIVEDITTAKPDVRLDDVKTTVAQPSTRYNNKITVVPNEESPMDEKWEEETNEIGGAWKQVNDEAVHKEALSGGFYFSHPGILAAVIGGGVVGLLCAILLVMFIVYRMRKKDEGSYPLDDSKPLKNYAYAKAPSREFYA